MTTIDKVMYTNAVRNLPKLDTALDICSFVRFYQSRMFEHWADKRIVLERQMAEVNDATKEMLIAVSEIIEAMGIFKKKKLLFRRHAGRSQAPNENQICRFEGAQGVCTIKEMFGHCRVRPKN